jgi:hypothetical protein
MEECGICYNAAANMSLPCKHTLCTGCFSRLVRTQCPFCRREYSVERDPLTTIQQTISEEIAVIDALIGRLTALLPAVERRRRRRRQLTETEIQERRAKVRARQRRHREHQGRFYTKRWWAEINDLALSEN